MKKFSRERLIAVFVLALFCFLVLGSSLISYQQRNRLRNNALRDIQGDLELMTVASQEALLKHDYVALRNVINRWGGKRGDFREVRVVAPNGFAVAEYRSVEPAAGETFSLSSVIQVGQIKLATLYLTGDYSAIDKLISGSRKRLFIGAAVFTLLLGAALWVLLRKMALTPLEDAVSDRTKALLAANQELEQLTNNSPS